jgi:uncharacterized protein YjiS (DUF1127 family)
MNLRTLSDSGGITALTPPAKTSVVAADVRPHAPDNSLWHVFRDRYTRARAKRELEMLDDRLLRDIGLEGDFEPMLGSCWDCP